MVDIFKNNLKEFDINNNTNNTIICNANEIETSDILNSLSPAQKGSIHLNVKIFSDKDIENFIYLEQNGNYKSINIILNADFNLSKTACEKLSSLVTINSVLKYNADGKFKGASFKNYSLMTAVVCNLDTTNLLNSETLYFLKNFTKREDNYITILNVNYLSKEIFHYFKEKQYNNIHIQVTPDSTFTCDIDLLYIIFKRISDYTNSININIENTIKFNIIYTKVIEDIKEDNEKFDRDIYNNLSFCGYHFILYQTLINLNVKANLVLGKLVKSEINNNTNTAESYYIQVNFDKHWFNLDIVWNYNYLKMKDEPILKSDKEFFKTHSTKAINVERCNTSYKKFYKKYKFFRLLKNKFGIIFNKNKKDYLGLPEPNVNYKKCRDNSIFQDVTEKENTHVL